MNTLDQQLELITKVTSGLYTEDSPLILDVAELYRDRAKGESLLKLTWKNISAMAVRAIKISVEGLGTFGEELETVDFQYDGLNAEQGDTFGDDTPIVLSGTDVANFKVALKLVALDDGNVWRNENGGYLERLPAAKPLNMREDAKEQLKRELAEYGAADSAACAPQNAMGLWQCGCGSWQYKYTPCLKCHIEEETLEQVSEIDGLTMRLTEYKAEQERERMEREREAERRRIEEEARIERQRIAQEAKEKEEAAALAARKARVRRRTLIIGGVVAALAVGGWFGGNALMRANKYKAAVNALKSNDFVTAQNNLLDLGNYKDSATLLKELEADRLFTEGEYADAYELYTQLPEAYRVHENDYASMYKQAEELVQVQDFDGAKEAYAKLGNYRDAAQKLTELDTLRKRAEADNAMEAGDYDTARAAYEELGDEEMAREADYRKADSQSKDEPWLAFEGFEALGDYKDSAERAADLFSRRYPEIGEPDNNGLRVYTEAADDRQGLLDEDYEVAVEAAYTSIEPDDNDNYIVSEDGSYGVMNADGALFVPALYGSISAQEGYYDVESDGKHGLVDGDGKVVIEPKYDVITPADEYYDVEYDGKHGLADSDGREIIAPEYDSITPKESFFDVESDGKHGLVDGEGEVRVAPEYDSIEVIEDAYIIVTRVDGGDTEYIVLDANGEALEEGIATLEEAKARAEALTAPESVEEEPETVEEEAKPARGPRVMNRPGQQPAEAEEEPEAEPEAETEEDETFVEEEPEEIPAEAEDDAAEEETPEEEAETPEEEQEPEIVESTPSTGDGLIPATDLWGCREKEVLDKVGEDMVRCKVADARARRLSGVEVEGYTMDVYYVFAEKNGRERLSKIAYILADSQPDADEVNACVEALTAAMSNETGDPADPDAAPVVWNRSDCKVEIGKGRFLNYNGSNSVTAAMVFTGRE